MGQLIFWVWMMGQIYDQQTIVRGQISLLQKVLREEFPFLDCEALGRWCGLPSDWWLPERELRVQDYLTLIRQLHLNDVPNIALRVANRTRIEQLGVMGYAILASPTLAHGLQLACQMAEQTAYFARISVSSTRDHTYLGLNVSPEGADVYQLLIESALISLWRYIQVLLPDGLAACASHATVNYAAPAYHWQYQQMLGCKVEFNQSRSALAIPRQWLQVELQPHTFEARALFAGQAKRLLKLPDHSDDIVGQVKRVLIEKPGMSRYSLELTAPLLSLSARSLRRYLQQSGSSFRAVCIEVRMELALDYLHNTPLTAQEIAFQLGYNQVTNFYRAFKAYTGKTPEQIRQQQ